MLQFIDLYLKSIKVLTYFNLTTVLTVPSGLIFLTRLKSPTKIEPSGAAVKATGAKSLCLDATPEQLSPHSNSR